MVKDSFSEKITSSGCCKKCGIPLEWRPESVIGKENTTPCMVSAEAHIQELRRGVAQNTLYCPDCRSEITDNLLLNILLFPIHAVKVIARLFSR